MFLCSPAPCPHTSCPSFDYTLNQPLCVPGVSIGAYMCACVHMCEEELQERAASDQGSKPKQIALIWVVTTTSSTFCELDKNRRTGGLLQTSEFLLYQEIYFLKIVFLSLVLKISWRVV